MKKIYIATLGCAKNLVDSEVLGGQLTANQFQLTEQPSDADILIVNTCGFIEDAKEESIQAILEAVQYKKDNPAKKVLVAGCLSQRYKNELQNEIPEVDGYFGTEDFAAILTSLGGSHAASDLLYRQRRQLTPPHFAYLKISEGCNHTCAFCAIPAIRGAHRSRTIESLVEEARILARRGLKELIVVSQDTSYYGKDNYGRQSISRLLSELEKIDKLEWIRVLYWYPSNFPPDVLDIMKQSEKIVNYIDMPIQHISERMLRLMRRGDTRESLLRIFDKIRTSLPDVALRTTVILGHPGETEADFKELLSFLAEIRFDRLGTFIYSDEDGTAAFALSDKVDREVALERQREVMELQQSISQQKNSELIGTTQRVLLDEKNSTQGIFIGRTYRDAPEIDNEVIVKKEMEKGNRKAGNLYDVYIEDATEYELFGKFL